MKFSRIKIDRITFQSVVDSPNSKQMDSRANLTAGGGLVIDFTSTKFCFLIDCTANFFQNNFQFQKKEIRANQTKNETEMKKNENKMKKTKIKIMKRK